MENNTEKNNSLDDWSKYLSEEESPSWLKNGGYMLFTTILSTTTINIISLVVIVLRGHFEKDDGVPIKSNEDDVKKYTSTSSISGKEIKYLYH